MLILTKISLIALIIGATMAFGGYQFMGPSHKITAGDYFMAGGLVVFFVGAIIGLINLILVICGCYGL